MNKKIIALLVTKGTRDFSKALNSIKQQGKYIDEIIIASEIDIDSEYQIFINPYKKGLARNTMQALVNIKIKYPKEEVYIATIDDDDFWRDNYIKKAREKIDEGYNFISGYLDIFNNNKKIDIYKFDNNLTYKDFLYHNPGIQGSNKVFSLDIALKSGGMPKHINSSTDRAFNINLLLFNQTKLGIIKDIVCQHNADDNRERITNSSNKKKELRNFYKHFWHLIDKDKIEQINQRHLKLHNIKEVIKWK